MTSSIGRSGLERGRGKGQGGGRKDGLLTASKNKHRPSVIIHHRHTPQREQFPQRDRLLGHLPRERELRVEEARQEE